MPNQRHVLAALAAASAAAPLCAQTAPFSGRMIRIVPFGTAGGPIDGIARAYADRLQARWGQTVIVEAKPGTAGNWLAE
jgi:tripartite-type tricarboxylate transporter receptor subunit TctC